MCTFYIMYQVNYKVININYVYRRPILHNAFRQFFLNYSTVSWCTYKPSIIISISILFQRLKVNFKILVRKPKPCLVSRKITWVSRFDHPRLLPFKFKPKKKQRNEISHIYLNLNGHKICLSPTR